MGFWSNKRVTLMGLGRHGGGIGAARWLAHQGALVTITDLAPASALQSSLAAIADLPLAGLRLGQHVAEDFTSAEVVVVNPAVPPSSIWLQQARQSGAQIVTEIELLLNQAPPQVVGVTGSNGKTTTADMLRAMLETEGRRVWLGGNIGGSLLDDLPAMRQHDWLVIELSSFQLHYLSNDVRAPRVAVVTNCTPNHLDWHGGFDAYAQAKRRLLELQPASGVAVINPAAASIASWARFAQGSQAPAYPDELIPPLQVQAAHFRQNARCAAAAARSIGVSDQAIHEALANYRSLPHRLEVVAHPTRRCYNDSKATTPEAAIAALEAVEPPVCLLAGGYAKGGDYERLAETIVRQARGAALFGAAGAMLADLIHQRRPGFALVVAERLNEAFAWCYDQSSPGEAILLSPACASFDQYRDYIQRGEHFRQLVRRSADQRLASEPTPTLPRPN